MPTPLDIGYLTALGLGAPWLISQHKRRQNLGVKFAGSVRVPSTDSPRVWFHGVSVGEIHLLRVVLERFRHRRPDVDVVVSSTTDTGLAEANRIWPELPVIAYPLDFSWAVRRTLREVRPDLLVLAESELWPGMLAAAQAAKVPVVVINGRLSPKSRTNYARLGPLARTCLNRVATFAVQSPEYAANLLQLGVPANRVVVTGSVKYDGAETHCDNPATQRLRALFNIRPEQTVLVAGSTQAPEEQFALDVAGPYRLIVVPRQKDRFDEVAALLAKSGRPFVRRSQMTQPAKSDEIILVDTIGELRAVWGLADIAFVGGTFDGVRGGQNMIEPAAYGAATVFGPHTWNFKATVEQLLAAGGAVQVTDAVELKHVVARWIEPANRVAIGAAAQAFVRSQQGATERTIDALERWLPQDASLKRR